MLLFSLTTFILLILAKVFTPNANWSFSHPWHPSQFRVDDYPIQCLVCSPSSRKSVCSGLTQAERWFPIQASDPEQDNGFMIFSTLSANPKQSRPGITSKQYCHPIQPIPSARPKRPDISLPPHQARPNAEHSPSNQSASYPQVPLHYSLVVFSDFIFSAYRSNTTTSSILPETNPVSQPNNQTAQLNDFYFDPNDLCFALNDLHSTQGESNLSSNRMVYVRSFPTQVLPSFTGLFVNSRSLGRSNSFVGKTLSEVLHSSSVL